MPIYEEASNKKLLLTSIISGALSGLLMTILWWAVVQPLFENSEVPDVTGKKVEIAKSILEGRGFRVYQEDAISDPAMPDGAICKQDPPPGIKTKRGSTIKVWPNNAGTKVPVMANMNYTQATVVLQQAGLKLGQIQMQPTDSIPKDVVISSNPPFGAQVTRDSQVDLVVSAGAGEVAVPLVRNYGITRATELIKQAGLNIGEKRYRFVEDTDVGIVVGQDPPAGTKVAKGSNVNLTICSEEE